MMSEWKEGAPEEPEKKDVQIPEAEKPEENVQNGAEQEENGEKRDREGRGEEESEEGTSSPFYSKSGTPGYCQVTVGQS